MKIYSIMVDHAEMIGSYMYNCEAYSSRDKALAKIAEIAKVMGGKLYVDNNGAYEPLMNNGDVIGGIHYDIIELELKE